MRPCSPWSGDRCAPSDQSRWHRPRCHGPRRCCVESSALAQSSAAPIAQTAERLHGKEKVYGSIPYWGSVNDPGRTGSGHRVGVLPQFSPGGGVAQSEEQAAHNRCVAGSSPATATTGPAYHALVAAGLTAVDDSFMRERHPWPPPTFGPRSRWRARSASTATTSPTRTGATITTGSPFASTARTATSTGRTARPAEPRRLPGSLRCGS